MPKPLWERRSSRPHPVRRFARFSIRTSPVARLSRAAPSQTLRLDSQRPISPSRRRSFTFNLEVRYSPTPDPDAVDETHKQVDTRTYDHPTDLSGLGDAAFWIGQPNNVTSVRFRWGHNAADDRSQRYRSRRGEGAGGESGGGAAHNRFQLWKPVNQIYRPKPASPGPNQTALDRLKSALTAKADAGDAKAQLALGQLYQDGAVAPNGTAQHDYAGAAYWYHQASDRGNAQAA